MQQKSTSILLVEDQDAVRTSLENALRHCGYEVTAVADAISAQAILRNGTIDLLLTDIALSAGMDGLTLAAWAREHTPILPIVVISGMLPAKMAAKFLNDRLFTALSKPFGIGQLLAAVDLSLKTVESVQ